MEIFELLKEKAFQRFTSSKMLSFAMVQELKEKINNPLIFKGLPVVKNADDFFIEQFDEEVKEGICDTK